MRDFFEFASKYAMAIDHRNELPPRATNTAATKAIKPTAKNARRQGKKVQMHKVYSSDHRNASWKKILGGKSLKFKQQTKAHMAHRKGKHSDN